MQLQFFNSVFQDYIIKNTSQKVRDRAFESKLTNLEVTENSIIGNVKGTFDYVVKISLNKNKISKSTCSCPYDYIGVCKHIVLVLIEADEYLRQQEIGNSIGELGLDIETLSPTTYTIKKIDFKDITYPLILQNSNDTSHRTTQRFSYFEVDTARFNYVKMLYVNIGHTDSVEVNYDEESKTLSLNCACKQKKIRMCSHQSLVLQEIINSDNLLLLFDEHARTAFLKDYAKLYGMEKVSPLQDYFEIQVNKYGTAQAKPKVKGLIPVSDQLTKNIKQQLELKPQFNLVSTAQKTTTNSKRFLLLSLDRYVNQTLQVGIYQANLTKELVVKNPISKCEVEDLLLDVEQVEEVKFYASVSKVSELYRDTTEETEMKALSLIFKNPLGLDYYLHDRKKSDNITSSSIEQIKLKIGIYDLHIKISYKDSFYEIKPILYIDNKIIPTSRLKLKMLYFILENNTYYFINSLQLLKVLRFFKEYNGCIVLHESSYENFKEKVLKDLEKSIQIDYTYLKKANSISPIENISLPENNSNEHIIYISESDTYILLTPVIKYSSIEIPILTKQQIELTNAGGENYIFERDTFLENAFIATLKSQHDYFEEQEGNEFFYLSKNEFLNDGWFYDAFELWKDNKYTILGFNSIKNNNLSIHKAKISVNVSSGIDWFETSVQVGFGNQEVSLKQLQKAVKNKTRYITLDDGTQGVLPDEWVTKLATYFRTGEVSKGKIRTSKMNFSIIEELYDLEMLDQSINDEIQFQKQKLASFKEINTVEVPEDLQASLRDYQKEGLNWLNFLDEFGFGGCLADDMGLGKTVQVLAFLLHQRKIKPAHTNLVVVPTSLLFNWQNEVIKFAPSLKIYTIYGSNRVKSIDELSNYDLVLTSYGTLMSDVEHLRLFEFNYIVLDESQAIKNPDSQRYKAVRLLQAKNRLVMTGTPIENNTFDLYAQLSFACPGLLGSQQHFKDEYAIPIDKFKEDTRALELQRKINPFVLRRTKKQVATELPDKTEMILYCEMGNEQQKVYDAYKKEVRDYLKASKEQKKNMDSFFVLAALTKLRQICNSPALLNDEADYGSESAKISVLMEEIKERHTNHKILVFSQFVGMLDLIKKELDKEGIQYAYLTGQSTKREKIVEEFQENDAIRVFLISLKAGGTGLNLTQAEYVYLVDPWWNPAVENQAIDRCYRIGQEKHVIATRLITPNTIEDKIMELQQSKRNLAADIIQTDTSILKALNQDDLLNLFQ